MQAHNTFAAPDAVKPVPFEGVTLAGGTLTLTLPAKSVAVIELRELAAPAPHGPGGWRRASCLNWNEAPGVPEERARHHRVLRAAGAARGDGAAGRPRGRRGCRTAIRPIIPGFPHILHGGDWSPEQWLHEPGVIDEDFRLMEKTGCNAFSIGIFAWSTLEPEEGRFEFAWLDDIMDRLAAHGYYAFLATPSGGKPRWMSEKYPEVRRINRAGQREPHGGRHNHCFTSPVFREKVRIINTKLAERYKGHKALAGWHISNEYSGACLCHLLPGRVPRWLKTRYASLDALNRAWWTAFWSQTIQSWDQIEPFESPVDGLNLDWDRFVTHQTVDFMKHEIVPLRAATPSLPVTTNMMTMFVGLDYWRFADLCDRISWDAYPRLHAEDSWRQVTDLSLLHDMYRSMKGGLPFILMESSPSATNWMQTPQLKKPGQHRQEMLLAIGHGADTTMYFQWRQSLGAAEKFHGAVVEHGEAERTRVFSGRRRARRVPEAPRRRGRHDGQARGGARLRHGGALGADVLAGAAPDQSADAVRQGLRGGVPGALPAVLEARDSRRRHREPLGLHPLPPHRRAHAVHAEAGRRRTASRRSSRTAGPSCSPICPAS